jgi:hypothetical protein
MRDKLTKVQAAAIARTAAAVPDGIAAAQYQVQLPIELAKSFNSNRRSPPLYREGTPDACQRWEEFA